MKRSFGLRRHASTPQARAEAKLDRYFSLMIRERDMGLPCILCGKHKPQYEAGHYRMREKQGTRFDPRNVNAECIGCNHSHNTKYGKKDMALYAYNIDQKWGEGTANELFKISMQTKQWDVRELEQLSCAARIGYAVYLQLYNGLTSETDMPRAAHPPRRSTRHTDQPARP
jgi:hypothetical protein